MEKCGHLKKFCKQYDALYCPECDVWTEKKCDDKDCEFCSDRPKKPSQVLEEKD